MSDTIREQIIQKIIARLAVIKISGGYNTDIGKKVYRARQTWTEADLPGVNVIPQVEESSRIMGKVLCLMPVRIEAGVYMTIHPYSGWAYIGETNASIICEKILGDIIKCITDQSALATWTGGLTDDVYYTGGGAESYPEPGDDFAGAFANFNVSYKFLSGNPYSQS